MTSLLPARPALMLFMAGTLTLVGMGCGGEGTSATAPEPEAAATPVVVDDPPETADDPPETADADDPLVAPTEVPTVTPVDTPEPEAVRYLPELSIEDTVSGPRPLLSWTAVDGAARYTLVVLDADGTPYWAWSGSETAVNIGGFDDPDAIGPWVHEPMTWTVAATDPDGTPIAISEPGVLTP